MTVSVVTLDWNTLAVKQFWQVPRSQIVADADFGCAPTLFPGPTGKTYFGCINKSSIYYVFDEANVSAGPIWEVQLGPGGEKGGINGSVASSAYVNGVLYIPTALATIDEQSFGGSIGAFDALTGQTLWRFGTAAPIVGSVITANGLLFDSQGHTFEVRDQLTGTVLYSFTAGIIKGSVTVLQGVVYIPDFDHHIYALTVH
jgi:outer membrane protein assembly factor BamB